MGADQHAVPTAALNIFDHELAKVLKDVGEIVGLGTLPRWDVLEKRGLTEKETDHLGDVAVHRFVVGNARPGRVCNRHVSCAIRRHQAWYA